MTDWVVLHNVVLSFDINKRLQREDACEGREAAAEGQRQTRDQRNRGGAKLRKDRDGGGQRWGQGGGGGTPGAADVREAGEKRLSRRCLFNQLTAC